MRREYYLHKRQNGIFYVEFISHENGKKLSARSTGEKGEIKARVKAELWKAQGIPTGRARKPRPIEEASGIEAVIRAMRRTGINPDDALRIVSTLKGMGLIDIAAVSNAGKGAVPFAEMVKKWRRYQAICRRACLRNTLPISRQKIFRMWGMRRPRRSGKCCRFERWFDRGGWGFHGYPVTRFLNGTKLDGSFSYSLNLFSAFFASSGLAGSIVYNGSASADKSGLIMVRFFSGMISMYPCNFFRNAAAVIFNLSWFVFFSCTPDHVVLCALQRLNYPQF